MNFIHFSADIYSDFKVHWFLAHGDNGGGIYYFGDW